MGRVALFLAIFLGTTLVVAVLASLLLRGL
jgi:hypothetical protein